MTFKIAWKPLKNDDHTLKLLVPLSSDVLNKKIFRRDECLKFVAHDQHVSYLPTKIALYLAKRYPDNLKIDDISLQLQEGFGHFELFQPSQ